MSLAAKLRRAPLRAVTGAFILNSGISKLSADDEHAKQLHGMASGTYGFLGKVDPKLFAKGLAAGEMTLGAALLAPIVPPAVAGLGLAGFSGALLNMYWNTPGMHEPGDPRPTAQGTAVAKDVWMFGIGTGLVVDGLLSPAHDKRVELTAAAHGRRKGKQVRKERKQAKKARAELRAHALEAARETQIELGKRARKAGKQARKQAKKAGEQAQKQVHDADLAGYADNARKASEQVRSTASDLYDQYAPVVAEKAKQARSATSDLYDEYAPVAVDRAKQARSAATDLYDEYAPVVAEKAKQARSMASELYDEASSTATKRAKQSRRSARRGAKRAKKATKRAKKAVR